MNLADYIVNRTSDYTPNLQPEYLGWYKKHWYSSIGIAFLSAYVHDEIPSENLSLFLNLAAGLMVSDLVIRAVSGNKGNKPVAGLIGLLRNLVSKQSN